MIPLVVVEDSKLAEVLFATGSWGFDNNSTRVFCGLLRSLVIHSYSVPFAEMNMFYFPLLVLQGVYRYLPKWICFPPLLVLQESIAIVHVCFVFAGLSKWRFQNDWAMPSKSNAVAVAVLDSISSGGPRNSETAWEGLVEFFEREARQQIGV